MEQDKKSNIGIVEIAAIVIFAPIIVGAVITVLDRAVCGVYNVFGKLAFTRRMNKGIKEGKIIQINGDFYNVEKTPDEKE